MQEFITIKSALYLVHKKICGKLVTWILGTGGVV